MDENDRFWPTMQPAPGPHGSFEHQRHEPLDRTHPAKLHISTVPNHYHPDEEASLHTADGYRPTQEMARDGESTHWSPSHLRSDRRPSAAFNDDSQQMPNDPLRVNTSPPAIRAHATPTSQSKQAQSVSTGLNIPPGSHQRKVEYKGLKDVPMGPKSLPHAEPVRPKTNLYPIDKQVLVRPHIFISSDHLAPSLKQLNHIRGWARPFSALDVHVDNHGYYITFDDDRQGHLNLEGCCERNSPLFGNRNIRLEEYHHGQIHSNRFNFSGASSEALSQANPQECRPASRNDYAHERRTPPLSHMNDDAATYDDELDRSSDNIVVSNRGVDFASRSRAEDTQTDITKPTGPVADIRHAQTGSSSSSDSNTYLSEVPQVARHFAGVDSFQSRPSSSSGRTATSDSVASNRCFVCKENRETQPLHRCSTCPRRWHRPCVPGPRKPNQREVAKSSWQCPNCIKKGKPLRRKESPRSIQPALPKALTTGVAELQTLTPSRLNGSPSEASTEEHPQRRANESVESFTAINGIASVAASEPNNVAQDTSTHARKFVGRSADDSMLAANATDPPSHHRVLNVIHRGTQRRHSVETPRPLRQADRHPRQLRESHHQPALRVESPKSRGDYTRESNWLEVLSRFRPTVREEDPPPRPSNVNQEMPKFEAMRETTEHDESGAAQESNRTQPHVTATTTDASLHSPHAASPAPAKDCADEDSRTTSSAGPRPGAFKARRTKTKPPTIISSRNCKQKTEQDAKKSHLCVACKSLQTSLAHITDSTPTLRVAVPAHKPEEQSLDALRPAPEAALHFDEQAGRELSGSSEPLTSLPTEETSRTPHDTSPTDGMFSRPASHWKEISSSEEMAADAHAGSAQAKEPASPLQTPTKTSKSRAKDSEIGDSATKKRRVMRIGGENLGDSFQRPKGTYEKLIGFSMQDATEHRMQARGVCNWIAKNVTSYTMGIDGWESGIGATLSIHEGTRGKQLWSKVEWRDGEPDEFGKGCWYTLKPGVADNLLKWDPIAKQPIDPPASVEKSSEIPTKSSEGPTKSKPSKRTAEVGSLPSPAAKKPKRDRSKPAMPDLQNEAMDIDTRAAADISTEKFVSTDMPQYKLDTVASLNEGREPKPLQDSAAPSSMDVDVLASMAQRAGVEKHGPSSELDSTRLRKAPAVMPLVVKRDRRIDSGLVRCEVAKVKFTSKDLFKDWPQYDPDRQFDREAKLAEIKRRPTRKQMFGKGPIHSRLGDDISRSSWAELCRSSTDKGFPRDGNSLPDRYSKRSATSFRPEDSIRTFTSVREFLGMPNDPLPILKNGQVVYRDGSKDEFGQLTRTRETYKTGL